MDVLVISAEFPPAVGGVGTFALNLSRALDRRGATVRVITSTPAARPVPVEFEVLRGSGLWNRRYVKILSLLRSALVLCRDQQPERVVAMTWGHDGAVAYLLARLFGRPYSVVVHGSELIGPHRGPRKWLMQRVLSGADVIIANSGFTKELACDLVASGRPVAVVHPPVEVPALDMGASQARADERFDLKGRRVILTAARLVRRKGHAIVFEVLADLRRAFPDVIYLVAGNGPYRSTLEQLRVHLGLAEHVQMLGVVSSEDLHSLFARADIYASSLEENPQDVEGFGIAVAQACAYGKPVIAGRSGGVVDIVVHGVTGLLIEPGNAEQLKEALRRLLDDRLLRETLGAAGRGKITREMTFDTQGRKLVELLTRKTVA